MANFVVIHMGFKAFWRATNTRGARRHNFTNAHWDNSLGKFHRTLPPKRRSPIN